MEVIEFNKSNIKKLAQEAAEYLVEGKIVAIPTDTCYGLAADATNIKAVRRIFRIKKRPEDKPLSVFLSGREDLENYVVLSDLAKRISRIFPEHVTVIFRARPSNLVPGYIIWRNTVGIRIPPFEFPRAIVEYLGAPITATSANIYGQPPIYDSKKLLGLEGIDCIIDSGKLPPREVSTVIDVSEGDIRILRVGAIGLAELREKLRKLSLHDYKLIVPK